MKKCICILLSALILLSSTHTIKAQDGNNNDMLFAKSNLLAWCIVPFDSKKRNSEERALMLKELGINSFVYDMRDKDLPDMENEFNTMKKYGIAIKGVWFWIDVSKDQQLNYANETILKTLAKTNTKTELWVSFPNKFYEGLTDKEKVQKGAKAIQYIHQRAAEIGCTVALYNHEDWFGEPANEVKIIQASGLRDVHIVYNFHHGHTQVDRFDEILKVTKPYLTTVNLNGMKGTKFNILTLSEGDRELEMIKKLKASGFNGSIGIIGHTENEDIKPVLERNIAGLKKLLAEMGDTKALQTYN
jgi:sugar phosphate isomerase/epimerase